MNRRKSKEEYSASQMEKVEMIQEREVMVEWVEDGVQLSLFNEEPHRGKRMEVGRS